MEKNEDTFREMLRIKTQCTSSIQHSVSSNEGEQSQKDDMKMLEERAKKMAGEAMKDQQQTKGVKTMSFIKSNEATAEMEALARRANPDEINIGSDDDEDEINAVEGFCCCCLLVYLLVY
jgi:hypothetical protein